MNCGINIPDTKAAFPIKALVSLPWENQNYGKSMQRGEGEKEGKNAFL